MTPVSFSSGGHPVSADAFVPSTGSAWPTVVVAYGTDGPQSSFRPTLNAFCQALADDNILVLLPDYFGATNTPAGFGIFQPGQTGVAANADRWTDILKDTAAHGPTLGAAAGRFGFVGFSLGAALALRAAAGSAAQCVVDFFGPMTVPGAVLFTNADAVKLPPVQIHHGDLDDVVKQTQSDELAGWLASAAVPPDYVKRYQSDGHPGQDVLAQAAAATDELRLRPAGWSSAAQAAATTASLGFLHTHL